MSQHIYLSTTTSVDGVFGSGTTMKYRGEAGPGDDVTGFTQKMRRLGHLVVVKDSRSSKEIQTPKVAGVPQSGPSVKLEDL